MDFSSFSFLFLSAFVAGTCKIRIHRFLIQHADDDEDQQASSIVQSATHVSTVKDSQEVHYTYTRSDLFIRDISFIRCWFEDQSAIQITKSNGIF